ncbi:MAG: flagellar hook-associated protein FlgK [Candidatus Gastranaerophilales bacterium]|nr:flagellar hook-associated protein FlgK [Candidatus Gastranaerophilales bacterium]
MTSGLFGFYTAQRSLMLNQAAINIINTNVANINTPGYSKQRLEVSQLSVASTDASMPLVAAQSGIGAVIDSISRNRDSYIDNSYRSAYSNYSYSSELSDNVGIIEDITNGLSDSGLTEAFKEFYNAAQQLNQNPTDTVIRTNFVQRTIDVVTEFNQISSQLTGLKTNLIGDISDTSTLDISKIALDCNDLNNKLATIADLNKTISLSTTQGNTPNSLLDNRDNLLDQISQYIPLTVSSGPNNTVNLSLGGTDLITGSAQVGYFNYELKDSSAAGDWTTNPPVVKIQDQNGRDVSNDVRSKITSGKMGAIIDVTGSDINKPTINNMLDKLNLLANEFAGQINSIQTYNEPDMEDDGITPTGTTTQAMCIDKTAAIPTLKAVTQNIFLNQNTGDATNITAANIIVNSAIISNPTEIATARINYDTATGATTTDLNGTGDGSNALLMAQLENKSIPNLNYATTEKYLNTVTSNFGVQVKNVEDKLDSNDTILQQVSLKRESASGVNLDEEYTDLIKFQRSYEASARIFNVVNDIMQKIMTLGV